MVIKSQEKRAKEEQKKKYNNNHKTIYKIYIYIHIITPNVNELNVVIKIHRVAECTQKQDPYIYCPQETQL